jgi:hypothetical protein
MTFEEISALSQIAVTEIMKRKPDPRARAFGVVPVTFSTSGREQAG